MEQRARNPRIRRRRAAAALLAAGALGLSAASAAGVGGLTTRALGADNGPVTSCDTNGITLAPGVPTFNPTTGHYVITTVRITRINVACRNRTMALTVADPSGISISSALSTVATPAMTVTFATSADVKSLAKVAVVIY